MAPKKKKEKDFLKVLKALQKTMKPIFDKIPKEVTINGYCLLLTCAMCPEQYDVFNRAGKRMGYLRLRHGSFSASYPECGGKIVYSACPKGDGGFEEDERMKYLTEAIKAIQNEDEQTALDMITEKES